jgi:hypothetical protein
MIFRVTMKDPDSLTEGINEDLDEELAYMPQDEAEAIREIRFDKAYEAASKWFEWGEYLTVEINTTDGTIRVVPVEEE